MMPLVDRLPSVDDRRRLIGGAVEVTEAAEVEIVVVLQLLCLLPVWVL